jgi:cell division protein FtsN
MANYERGVYEPGDEVRVFDGAEEEDEDVEGSRLPLLIVLALLVLAMFGGVVYLAYTQGVARGRGETPVLTAAVGPEKVAPESPGGSQVPYQGFKIYEQPAPSDDQADATDTTPAAPQAQAMTAPSPAKVEKPAPVKAVETPAAKPVVAMAPPPKPAPLQSTPSKPAPKVAAAPPPPTIATGAPRPLVTPATAAPAPTPAAAAPASGSYVLQIGAYKSQAEADAAWKTYQGKHAALLAGYGENVQQADLGAKGTWYRLRVAGFRDKEVASGVCDRLKADGGACFLGK